MAYSASNQKHTYHQAVATTDATETTLKSLPVKLNSIMLIKAFITAVRTGGTSGATGDSAIYEITHAAKNSAGTAVEMGSQTVSVAVEDQAAWDAKIDVSGGTARVRVTGAADNNITWNCTLIVTENN